MYADIFSRDGSIIIDVEDLSESEWREARELVGEDRIAAHDSRIPPRFRPGTPFVVVGAGGRLDAEVSAFRIGEDRDVKVHLKVDCPRQPAADGGQEDPRLSCSKQAVGPDVALVFRPDRLPEGLQLHRVRPAVPELAAKIDASVRAQVMAAATSEPRPAPSEIHITTTTARLPDEGVALVSVKVDGDDDEWNFPRLTGLGVADAHGVIIRWLSELEAPTDSYIIHDVHAVFDLDGDGLDEILITQWIFEGFRTYLMRPARGYALELVSAENP